ncbi:CobW family GTP-binding protein [Rhodopila sp.]|uniref:CobW family GTP-binding protein n=1 Tax=Rhodopila sp. TaxID=2480087 RepID=UPI003D0E922A
MPPTQPSLIPVSIVTGFLGSGKTTLISRILRNPAFRRTAVIVNEFGEVGLDHDLIATSDDSVVTLTTGCLCCAVQTDLARTLIDLSDRRAAGSANYDRVLIETSGLSDPVPILQAMITDQNLAARHLAPAVVTLVDSVFGETTLREHQEARHQIALADRLLISKTDQQTPAEALLARLARLNPNAPRATTAQADPALVFAAPSIAAPSIATPSIATLADRLANIPRPSGHNGIETITLTRDQPLPGLALTLLLQAVAEHCGPRLLRLKGLVAIEEMPGRPTVIHGVRHVVGATAFLDRWPSDDLRTRMVFIAKGVPRHFVTRLLEAIEEEVRDAMTDAPSRFS